ncbi:unnamed protein product, partial [Staurois parvus]
CIVRHVFARKNPNTCKLIGLRESYSVYKWRYIYWNFFF